MAEYQSIFTGQQVDNALSKLRNWINADGSYPTVTIDGITYAVVWKILPTSSNQVYGIGLHPTTGRVYQIYNNKGVYSATALDSYTDTKNTAGSGNTANKLYLVGAPSQTAAGTQTYSNTNVYEQNGKLYSNNAEVLTTHAAEYGKIKVTGGEEKAADSAQDTIEFAAGGNLSVARDGDKITYSYSTPGSLKNPNKLNLKINSETSNFVEYDGSAVKTVTFKPSTTAGALIISDGTTDKTIQLAGSFSDNDTKNTAGASNSNSKLFIIGAAEQSANPQTYSHTNVYIGTDHKLYSNNEVVVTTSDSRLSNARTPTNHASPATTYGIGTTTNYGHVKIDNSALSASSTNTDGVVAGLGHTHSQYSTTDTKNTAGSTNSSSKLFLIGAAEQSANPQTYSNSSVYTQSGKLYSNNKEVSVEGHTHSQYLTAHPTVTKETDTTSTASPAHGGTFTVIDSVTRETNGHVTKINTKTVTLPSDNDTKNTAGSSNSTSKLFLIGASSQNASGVTTYSNSAVYATAGQLDATKFRVAEKATMQYNSTEDCVEFIFA